MLQHFSPLLDLSPISEVETAADALGNIEASCGGKWLSSLLLAEHHNMLASPVLQR
jgi:hypothetical protein